MNGVGLAVEEICERFLGVVQRLALRRACGQDAARLACEPFIRMEVEGDRAPFP